MLITFADGFMQVYGSATVEQKYVDTQTGWLFYTGYIANLEEIASALAIRPITPDVLLLLHLMQESSPLHTARSIAGTASWIYWDKVASCLFIATDRLGITPIYYTQTKSGWLISDAIPPLLNETRWVELNRTVLAASVLSTSLPIGETFYDGIHQINPSNLVTVQAGQWREQTYWQASLQPILKFSSSEEYEEAYRNLLFKVVGQYTSDVNTGITLSSGLDSGSLAVAMRTTRPNSQITAISHVAPELPSADEFRGIEETCHMLDIQPIWIRADYCWTLKTPEYYTSNRAAPSFSYFADVWHGIFQEAQKHDIRVLIGGSGGDQLFGGSVPAYADFLIQLRWRELACQLRRHISYLALPSLWKTIPLRSIVHPILNTYWPTQFRKRPNIPSFIAPQFHPIVALIFTQIEADKTAFSFLPGRRFRLKNLIYPSEARSLDQRIKAANDYDVKMRYPFWDHRLIDFALSLPSDQFYHAGFTKWIVRRSLRGRLPETVLTRFNRVISSAIANRGLRERSVDTIKSFLSNMRLEDLGIVNAKLVRQAYQDYLDGKAESASFYRPVLLEAWLRRWF